MSGHEPTVTYRLEVCDRYENWEPQWIDVGGFRNPGVARDHALKRVHDLVEGRAVAEPDVTDGDGMIPGRLLHTDFRIVKIETYRSIFVSEHYLADEPLPFLVQAPAVKFAGQIGRDDLPSEQISGAP